MRIARRAVLVGVVAAGFAACRARPTDLVTDAPVATMPPTPAPAPTTAAPTTTAPAVPDPTPTEAAPPTATPSTPVAATVLCRSSWGAAPAGPTDRRHAATRVTIHHTASVLTDNRQAPGRWRGYQRFHQDQGWTDIAYHVGVDRDGNLYELRADDVPGDTFTDYDPTGHHLIVVDGNFDEQDLTPAQLESAAQAAAAACARLSVDPATIGGHRDHASTSCPGAALYDALPALRTRAAELVAGGIGLVELCGPEADARVAAIEA